MFPAISSDTTVGLTQWEWDDDQRATDSGEPAPRAGLWPMADDATVRCRAALGNPMPSLQGQPVSWYWSEQTPPGARATSGQPCPYHGVWHCEDTPPGPQAFAYGAPLPQVQERDVTWILAKPL